MRYKFLGRDGVLFESVDLLVYRKECVIYIDYRNYKVPLHFKSAEESIEISYGFSYDIREMLPQMNEIEKQFFEASGFAPIMCFTTIADPTFVYAVSKIRTKILERETSNDSYIYGFLEECRVLSGTKIALSDGQDSFILKKLIQGKKVVSVTNSTRVKLRMCFLGTSSKNFHKIDWKRTFTILDELKATTWHIPNVFDILLSLDMNQNLVFGHTGDFLRNGHYTGETTVNWLISKYFRKTKQITPEVFNYINDYYTKFRSIYKGLDEGLVIQSFGFIHRQLPFLIASNHLINEETGNNIIVPFWNFDFAVYWLSRSDWDDRKKEYDEFYKSILGIRINRFIFLRYISAIEYKYFSLIKREDIYHDKLGWRKYFKVPLVISVIKHYEKYY